MRRWLALLATTFLLSACGQAGDPADGPSAFAGAPKPALWKIADEDTTIYLFGTIHLLPPGLDWDTPAFKKAFAEAGTVYFEADTEIPPADISAMVLRLGMLPSDQRLSGMLTQEQWESLRASSARFGISFEALDRMRPWYASVVISDAAIRNAGFEPDSGVENILRPAAKNAGKGLRYLETVEQQLRAYTDLPDDVQVRLLDAGLQELDTVAASLTEMVADWRSGDDASLADIVIGEQLATQPEIYQTLTVRRNASWAPQLDAIMREEAGTFMVAVGAGHLLGPDSVLVLLEQLGHAPARVQ